MKFINALDQAKAHIKTLWCVLVIVSGFAVLALLGWMHSASKITVRLPPHIPTSGLTLTQDVVPKASVYSFAFYVWQSLNHWPKNGLKDYQQTIKVFSPFLTPSFKNTLIQNYNTLLNNGELQDRMRTMQGIDGSEYSPNDVIILGHDTWIVHLKMRLTETMNGHLNVVKDVQMNYSIKVVRYNVDSKSNPWGLALDDFAQRSSRIKTII